MTVIITRMSQEKDIILCVWVGGRVMWVDVYVCGCADLFYWLECTVTLARMNQISVIKEPSITPIIVILYMTH